MDRNLRERHAVRVQALQRHHLVRVGSKVVVESSRTRAKHVVLLAEPGVRRKVIIV